MEVCERLKVIRLLKGWSQEALAEKLGLSLNGYARIERGETDINITKLQHVADVMQIELSHLLGLDEKNVFNVVDSEHSFNLNRSSLVLSESQCAHELEKTQLLLQEREKEIVYLKKQNQQQQQIIDLMKKNK